jgi:hypothetical protein
LAEAELRCLDEWIRAGSTRRVITIGSKGRFETSGHRGMDQPNLAHDFPGPDEGTSGQRQDFRDAKAC